MFIDLSVDAVYSLSSRIAAIWIIISALEGLSLINDYRSGGAFDSRVIAVIDSKKHWLNIYLGSWHIVAIILVIRLIFGSVLLFGSNTLKMMAVCWLFVAITTLFARWRRLFGDDGSDQMLTIMSVTYAVALLLGETDEVRVLGIVFMAFQAVLAYVAAGIAKLISEQWQSGSAIQGIFSTRTYSTAGVANVLRNVSPAAKLAAWTTIAFETAFILAFILPASALMTLLIIAAVFHLMSAVVMGLNGFVWAFISTYPPIIFVNHHVRTYVFKIIGLE